MIQKNVRFVILGLLLPLILLACMPQVEREGAYLENTSSAETAVPATAISTATAAAVPQSPTPSPNPQSSEASGDPADPTPLTGQSAGIDFETTPPSEATAPPAVEPAVQALVNLAKEDLAQRLGLPLDEIVLLSFELKEWPDGSLGCPQPGMNYTQVPQEGYLIRLQANDKVYHYHGGGTRDPFLCLQSSPQPEIVITRQPPLDIKDIATKIVPPPRD